MIVMTYITGFACYSIQFVQFSCPKFVNVCLFSYATLRFQLSLKKSSGSVFSHLLLTLSSLKFNEIFRETRNAFFTGQGAITTITSGFDKVDLTNHSAERSMKFCSYIFMFPVKSIQLQPNIVRQYVYRDRITKKLVDDD